MTQLYNRRKFLGALGQPVAAMAVVEAQRLPRDARVEIMLVAAKGARTGLK